MKYLKIWCLLIPTILFSGCKTSIPKGETKATVIEYKVTYLTEKAGKIPTKLLPGKMSVIFAGHYALNKIEGFFGQFSLIYIGNLKNGSVTTLLKLFDKKYVYYGKKGELPCGFFEKGDLKIEKTSDIQFLGYNCNQLKISEIDSSYYAIGTNELKINNPNITTPYRQIEEVLLDFNTRLSLLNMRLTATDIQQDVTVKWDLFKVGEEYKERPKEFIENTINELFK